MPRSRYRIFEENYPYFLTDTIVAWLPLFARPFAVEIVFDSWRFLQRERAVSIFGYVVMENHVHWIASAQDLSEKIGRFKSYTARRIVDELEHRGLRRCCKSCSSSSCATRSIKNIKSGRKGATRSRFKMKT